MNIKEKLEKFKNDFEKTKKKWKVFFQDYFDEEEIQDNTVYIVISSEEENEKQKIIELEFYYCKCNYNRNGTLEFRDNVREFLDYIKNNLENAHFYCIKTYKIEYSTLYSKGAIRVAKISGTFNYTTLCLENKNNEEYELMEILEDKINMY